MSDYAAGMVKDYIGKTYGEAYVGQVSGGSKDKKNVQDAHEAIRPTNVEWTPADLKDSLSRDQFRLYQLIWRRFVASAMKDARFDTLSVKVDAGRHRFTASDSVLRFDGFLSVYQDGEEEKSKGHLDKLTEGSTLELIQYRPEQHFTQPEPHFTEASLVRTMEEKGIGRPSTYAPTIMTLLARRYVIKEEKNLYVTELGEVVNQMMKQSFPSIVDVDFTANLEALLDGVEDGEIAWKTIVRNFYPDLDEAVKQAEAELGKVKIEDELSDEFCEVCGRQMVIKYGPYGKFLACPGFPECRNTKPYLEKIGVKCPKCGGEVLLKRTKKGRKYYGCEHNPDCDYMSWKKPQADEQGVAKE